MSMDLFPCNRTKSTTQTLLLKTGLTLDIGNIGHITEHRGKLKSPGTQILPKRAEMNQGASVRF
jgi:hypothetical protein